jgi:hypothetical protein
MRGGHAPTPFSAEEIRNGCPDGRVSIFRIEESGRDPMLQTFRFRDGDARGTNLEVSTTDLEGNELRSVMGRRYTWKELQSHASYPAEGATITAETVTTPAGTFDCWLYTVKIGPTTGKFWFAKKLPGPPILMTQETGGEERMRMILVEQK